MSRVSFCLAFCSVIDMAFLVSPTERSIVYSTHNALRKRPFYASGLQATLLLSVRRTGVESWSLATCIVSGGSDLRRGKLYTPVLLYGCLLLELSLSRIGVTSGQCFIPFHKRCTTRSSSDTSRHCCASLDDCCALV